MGGKLFCSYRTVFGLGQGLRDSKTSDLNCLYEALVQREALKICQDRVFGSFLCSSSIISSRERFMRLYCDTSSLGRSAPGGKKPSLFSYIPNTFICCKYIIKVRGKISILIAFYELFSREIKVKI